MNKIKYLSSKVTAHLVFVLLFVHAIDSMVFMVGPRLYLGNKPSMMAHHIAYVLGNKIEHHYY